MEQSKRIITIVVGLACILIIWKVGFQDLPEPSELQETTEQTVVAAADDVTEEPVVPERQMGARGGRMGTNFDPNAMRGRFGADTQGFTRDMTATRGGRGTFQPTTQPSQDESDPNDPLIAVSLNGISMRNIISNLMEWTGKPIIPNQEALNVTLTIYAPREIPRSQAISLIYTALNEQGYVARETEQAIFVEPIGDAVRADEIPLISADTPLATIRDKSQVVQKIFKLENYSPSQMGQILTPLMDESGYITADEDTGTLYVVDTVKNLMRIALIIEQFDIVESSPMVSQIFPIRHREPEEIVDLLESLMADSGGVIQGGGNARNISNIISGLQNRGNRNQRGAATNSAVSSTTVGSGGNQALLVADSTKKCVIVKATVDDMRTIEQWINQLDTAVETFWDPQDLLALDKNTMAIKFYYLEYNTASQMSQVIEPLLSDSGYLSAEDNTGTLMAYDTVDNLLRFQNIIDRFDVPASDIAATQYFDVRYGDPTEIVQLIRILLGEQDSISTSTTGRTTTNRNTTINRGR